MRARRASLAVRLLSLALVGAAASLAGCASVVSGVHQAVQVTPVCEGVIRRATCDLANDKGSWKLEAPGSVTVQKSYADLIVNCRLGTADGKATFVSKPNGGVYGNVLAGGLIGYAVDSANGAGYNYPQELPVVLRPPCPEPGEPGAK